MITIMTIINKLFFILYCIILWYIIIYDIFYYNIIIIIIIIILYINIIQYLQYGCMIKQYF